MTDPVPTIDDPRWVRDQYADSDGLRARMAFWQGLSGPGAPELARERVLALAPRRVLEVGCGTGEFAAELRAAGIDVVATDASAHMVAQAAARGVAAQTADVQRLPFADGAFDVVVANFMLYHVPDVTTAIAQLARVLEPGGGLVASTNSERRLAELWDLVGRPREPEPFGAENGGAALGGHFAHVTRIDVSESFVACESAIRDYVAHTRHAALAAQLPALPDGLRVTARATVFVATTAT